ncbi:16S rRNA (cytosine967-C5)-methyltransferase [Rhodobacter sp. JA431]|uniref:RsmB/NOP family class I SAM-dependent RNA methyltransferase n=1 Tax=Rhodobacter sp. JA431 TaxID=570013 RepID=UPI000BC71A03|nr:RsmB/NOP family class I SAM-dependent RNA methyltransferase [Rhodobacter sp. JA431]SOB98352.1 16S rRNA (cytosine967-C5)-methyltransferase [Rhodobacter sp. JA431]
MTPAARLAAAIDLLDAILEGAPAERALTNWARANRYAGSGDRAAVRDHVFDALRCRGSFAALGGSLSGRGLILGLCRAEGRDPTALFTGEGHAPAVLNDAEARHLASAAPPREELLTSDWPEWLLPQLRADLGADFAPVSEAMQARAPVFLRANLAKTTRDGAAQALAAEGIETQPHPLADTALEVTAGARKIAQSQAYAQGLVELQDAASQAMLQLVDLAPGARVLDYCAGGGGKALALAAAFPKAQITAHDIDAGRMRDIAPRAKRAGAKITLAEPGKVTGQYDLVLVDAPCSGAGTWRRTPEAKWRLAPARLAELVALQAEILSHAAGLVAPGGRLCYMTCSLLDVENAAQIAAFTARGGWESTAHLRLTPCDGADGFFGAVLSRI